MNVEPSRPSARYRQRNTRLGDYWLTVLESQASRHQRLHSAPHRQFEQLGSSDHYRQPASGELDWELRPTNNVNGANGFQTAVPTCTAWMSWHHPEVRCTGAHWRGAGTAKHTVSFCTTTCFWTIYLMKRWQESFVTGQNKCSARRHPTWQALMGTEGQERTSAPPW